MIDNSNFDSIQPDINYGVSCESCGATPITGQWMTCTECPFLSLCSNCAKSLAVPIPHHTPEHKIVPVKGEQPQEPLPLEHDQATADKPQEEVNDLSNNNNNNSTSSDNNNNVESKTKE